MNDEDPSDASDHTEEEPEPALQQDAFFPILILMLSFLTFLVWQISNLTSQHKAMQDASVRQDQMVMQSHQAQAELQKLASDLVQAAQTDDTARAIVTKYGIQMNGAPPVAPVGP